MKWLAATLGLIAILAVAALAVALKVGLAIPSKLEEMTINGPGLQATNVNLHIFMSNQTHREIAVGAVLDGSLGFGGSLIRDQHFGTSSLSTRAESGDHSLALIVAGRPEVTHSFTFATKPDTTNIVAIEIYADRQNNYRFSIKQSTKPIGVL